VLLAWMPAPLKAYRHLLSTLSFNDKKAQQGAGANRRLACHLHFR
jgi:hypothetical protein